MRIAQSAGVTDTGRRRRRNEDAYVLRPPLFAVADGMGGAQAGEIASRLATEALGEQADAGSAEERVQELVQGANRRVYERSNADAAVSGMGTTVTVALVEDGLVVIGHVGDSRAYLVRDGALEQLTEDHSLVGELMRSGKLSREEAESHPQRSVITRALGTDPDVDVDVFTLEARTDDIFLLCSDGLTSMVDDETILGTFEEHRANLEQAARALVAQANRGGGEDNITVVCFELREGDDAGDGAGPQDETMQLPPAGAAADAGDPDDEDTLDELDRVPAVDTMVVPPEEAARLAAPPPAPAAEDDRLDAIAKRVVAVLAVVLVVLGGIAALLWSLWG